MVHMHTCIYSDWLNVHHPCNRAAHITRRLKLAVIICYVDTHGELFVIFFTLEVIYISYVHGRKTILEIRIIT